MRVVADGRAHPAVGRRARAVAADHDTDVVLAPFARSQLAAVGRDAVGEPVHDAESVAAVRVPHHDRDGPRARRHAAPRDRRRHVLTAAFAGRRVQLGDHAVARRAQHVLHLHRLDDRDLLAGLHILAHLHRDRLEPARAAAVRFVTRRASGAGA